MECRLLGFGGVSHWAEGIHKVSEIRDLEPLSSRTLWPHYGGTWMFSQAKAQDGATHQRTLASSVLFIQPHVRNCLGDL